MSRELGILIGVAKPDQVTFESKRPVSIGEYVIRIMAKERFLGLLKGPLSAATHWGTASAIMRRRLRASRLRLRISVIRATKAKCGS